MHSCVLFQLNSNHQIGLVLLRQSTTTTAASLSSKATQPICVVLLQQQQQQYQQQQRWKHTSSSNRPMLNSATTATIQQQSSTLLHSLTANIGAIEKILSDRDERSEQSIITQKNKSLLGTNDRPLPPNMVYRPYSIAEVKAAVAADTTAPRPLVVILAWMLSKNEHIEKYRHFWHDRGYDTLSVQTSPFDLLLPNVGGKRNAKRLFDVLTTATSPNVRVPRPRYDQIVIHGFSVGGYQFCELLHLLSTQTKEGNLKAEQLYSAIRGMILDSAVFAKDCPGGLSRAITRHPVVQPLLEKSIFNFLQWTYPFTMKRYELVESIIFQNERRVPALLLFSKDDIVSSLHSNYAMVKQWHQNGGISKAKCWDKSAHVLHYKEHTEEYSNEVDKFVQQLPALSKLPELHRGFPGSHEN